MPDETGISRRGFLALATAVGGGAYVYSNDDINLGGGAPGGGVTAYGEGAYATGDYA